MKLAPNAAVKLLVALIFLFVSSPFVTSLRYGAAMEAVLLSMVMGFAVLVVADRHRTLVIALALLAAALAAKWISHFRPDLLYPAIELTPPIMFFAFVVANLLRFIVRAPRVDANVLCAGVAGFLILGLVWVPAYLMVARLHPRAFNLPSGSTMDGFNAFFFSFVTLCTVGYGDITPVSRVARMLAITEAITGVFYMAVLISRLVSLYSSNQPSADANGDDKP